MQRHLKSREKKATGKRKRTEPKVKQTRARKNNTTGVGTVKKKPAKLKKERTYGDDSDDEDEDKLDDAIPDYLKKRKRVFDAHKDEPDHSGLRLPPIYDEVVFSDDEHLEDLHERPNFTTIKPCAPYKDKNLRYSLGVIPAPIAQWLRDYQVQGAEFMHELIAYQKGGILGDDM